jgi:hypothetical protein
VPCEVDPNLPVASKHAIMIVLLADFHGRDPDLFVKTGQPFFTTLLDWCCPVRNPDPHGYREGMAALFAQDSPHQTYSFTAPDNSSAWPP